MAARNATTSATLESNTDGPTRLTTNAAGNASDMTATGQTKQATTSRIAAIVLIAAASELVASQAMPNSTTPNPVASSAGRGSRGLRDRA